VTKLSQCVTVHFGKAPVGNLLLELYLIRPPSAGLGGLLSAIV
jgi:hypothetical protein